MLGLVNNLSTSSASLSSAIVPSDITGLDAWFQFNKDIVGADGGASNDGDMANGEDINSWADQSGNDRHASQSTASKKPHWDTTTADLGGLRWPDDEADTSLNMASNVSIGANVDFTVMIRVKLTDFTTDMALIGSAAKHLIKWTDNARVGVFIGGNNPAEDLTDADACIINNIGVGNDNTLPCEGVFKDVIIWKGTALTDAQRQGVVAYIEAQT